VQTPPDGPLFTLRTVRVTLRPLGGGGAGIDTVADFPAGGGDLSLDFTVSLVARTQRFIVRLAAVDDTRDTVFRAIDTIEVTQGSEPSVPAPLVMTYAGPDSAVATVAISPRDTVILVGDTTLVMRASARRTNNTLVVGARVGWTLRDSSVMHVDRVTGRVRATAPVNGVWLVVTTANGRRDSVRVTAIQPVRSVVVAPDTLSMYIGTSRALSVVLRDAFGVVLARPVSWTSSDNQRATVNDSGVITALDTGLVFIRATSEGVTGEARLVVRLVPVASVTLLPAAATLTLGDTLPLNATARDSAGNVLLRSITLVSSNSLVIGLSQAGNLLTRGVGVATVIASSEGRADTSVFTVLSNLADSLAITPSPVLFTSVGDTIATTVRAIRRGVQIPGSFTFLVRDAGVASVDVSGRVIARGPGTTRLVVTEAGGKVDSVTVQVTQQVASVQVSPATATGLQGDTMTFTAVARDRRGNTVSALITWSSLSGGGVVSVSQSGNAFFAGVGSDSVFAQSGSGRGAASVTVLSRQADSVFVTPRPVDFTSIGDTVTVVAQAFRRGAPVAGSFSYTVRDTGIATVSAQGVVTARSTGTTQLVVIEAGGARDSVLVQVQPQVATVTVLPSTVSGVVGDTVTLTASAFDRRGNAVAGATFTWSTSSGGAVASVTQAGLVSLNGVGIDTAVAQSGSARGTAVVTVASRTADSIVVTPDTLRFANAPDTLTISAVAYRGGRTIPATFTFTSRDTLVATVNSLGQVISRGAGATFVVAQENGGSARDSAYVTVSIPRQDADSVQITPQQITIGALNETASASARAYRDGVSIGDGSPITFVIRDTTIATVQTSYDNIQGETLARAAVFSLRNGVTFLVAEYRGTLDSVEVRVDQIAASVSIAPVSATLSVGQTLPLSAVVKDANGNPIAGAMVTWTSDTTRVATVSGTGVVTAVSQGLTTVTARAANNTVSNIATITVTAAQPALSFIADTVYASTSLFTSASLSVPGNGTTINFRALDAGIVSFQRTSSPSEQSAALSDLRGLAPGQTRIVAEADGLLPDTIVVVVTAARFKFRIGPDTVDVGQQFFSLADLAAGEGEFATFAEPTTVTFTSLDPEIVSVPSGTVTGDVGAYYVQTPAGANATGTARVVVSARGFVSDTITYTVVGPRVLGYPDTVVVGAQQRSNRGQYITAAVIPPNGLPVQIENLSPDILTTDSSVTLVPNGSSPINITGIARGTGRIAISAAGYKPDTFVVIVTRAVIIPGTDAQLRDTVEVGERAFGTAYVGDTTGTIHRTNVPVVIRVTSSDTNVIRVVQPLIRLDPNQTYSPTSVEVVGVGEGTAFFTYSDDAGIMEPVKTPSVRVVAPRLTLSQSSFTVGRGQQFIPGFGMPMVCRTARTASQTVFVTSSNPGVARSESSTVVIPGEGQCADVQVLGLSDGTTTLTVSADGMTSSSASITVGQPGLAIEPRNGNIGYVGQGDSLSVYTVDQTGERRAPTGGLSRAVNVTSSNTGVATVPNGGSLSIPEADPMILVEARYNSTGQVAFSASHVNGPTVYSTGVSGVVTVGVPMLSLSRDPFIVGANQADYSATVALPYVVANGDSVVVSIRSSDARLTVGDNVTIRGGGSSGTFALVGREISAGHTIVASAPGFASDTSAGEVLQGGLSIAGRDTLVVGGTAGNYTIELLTPIAQYGYEIPATTVDTTPLIVTLSSNLRFLNSRAPGGSMPVYIPGGSASSTFAITADGSGPGTITVAPAGAPNYPTRVKSVFNVSAPPAAIGAGTGGTQ